MLVCKINELSNNYDKLLLKKKKKKKTMINPNN